MDLQIVTLKPGEAQYQSCMRLVKDIDELSFNLAFDDIFKHNNQFIKAGTKPDFTIIAAYYNGNLVGLAAVSSTINLINTYDHLAPLYVFKRYRGKGFGRALVRYALKEFPRLSALIGEGNKASQAVFKSSGFAVHENVHTFGTLRTDGDSIMHGWVNPIS